MRTVANIVQYSFWSYLFIWNILSSPFFSQAPTPTPDGLQGGVSLVGTIINGSVLAWLLLVHLPAKDKFIKELWNDKDKAVSDKDKQLSLVISEKDKQLNLIFEHNMGAIQSIIKEHSESNKHTAAVFQASLDRMTEHCREEVERVVSLMPFPREQQGQSK